jgi:glycosyltransferase involved in cell wall biosynthesis
MRILYDGAVYEFAPNAGVSRYFFNIISRLPSEYYPIITSYTDRLVFNYPKHPQKRLFQVKKFPPFIFSHRLSNNYFKVVKRLNRFDRLSLIHPTYYNLISISFSELKKFNVPIVLTVYDMIHEIFADSMDRDGHCARLKLRAIRAADKIICISESTKRDLLERISLPDDKITVTYLASEITANISYGIEPIPAKPYYLYVGSRSPYKNFDRLLLAFAKVVLVNPELSLCVVGEPFHPDERKMIGELNLDRHIEHYGSIDDRHLAKLYRCSLAFVYPSLYEGFGIPPLEAMSCGTPVVAANSSSIPEVVGEAGILFDPRSSNDLADILLYLADNTSERERLIAQGNERRKQFSWEKTTDETLKVYRSIARSDR